MRILVLVALLVLGYLLGSIPTAVWIGRRFHGVDVREHGSHNAGATNTIRVLGLPTGLAVFVLDVLKGFAAVKLALLATWLPHGGDSFILLSIALGVMAFLGHLFPVFAGFRGGKGVATLCGVVLALHVWPALCALGVFSFVLLITRYVSLGSMLAGLSYPLWLYFVFGERRLPMLIFGVSAALLLLFTHRSNIKRLVRGEESKFAPRHRGSLGR